MAFSDRPSSHIYIRVTNMKKNTIIDNELKYIDDEVFSYICKYTISKTDLYLTIAGTIGDVGEVPDRFDKMNLTENAAKLTNIICDRKYLMYTLLSTHAQAHFSSKFHQVAQPKLSIETANSTLVPIPPLHEQHRIVAEIEKMFALIDSLDENKQDLESAIATSKSKILDLAIHGKLVPQDPSDEPASELLKRINPKAATSCDNPHYENIPSTWVCTTIGSIFQHNTGKALNKSTSEEGTLLPYLTTSNVYWNSFDLSVIKEMRFKDSEIEKCTVKKGDLLVCEGGDIGRAAIWDKDYTICIQNHLHRMRPKGDVIPLLYLYYIMHLKLTNNIEGKGIGLQGLSSGMLDKMEVPLPPYNEQKRIVDKIQEAFYILEYVAESLS